MTAPNVPAMPPPVSADAPNIPDWVIQQPSPLLGAIVTMRGQVVGLTTDDDDAPVFIVSLFTDDGKPDPRGCTHYMAQDCCTKEVRR